VEGFDPELVIDLGPVIDPGLVIDLVLVIDQDLVIYPNW
jgi:hypothetical protein